MAVKGKRAEGFGERVKKEAKKQGVETHDVKGEIEGNSQKRLPGTEDAAIEDLEEAAQFYAKARDQRIAIQRREIDQKDVLLKIMKRHKKSNYVHGGISIEIVPEGERLKVRIVDDDE